MRCIDHVDTCTKVGFLKRGLSRRRAPRWARAAVGASTAALIVGAIGASACNAVLGVGDLQIGVACGAGTKLVSGQCVAAATDPRAPSFGGVTSVSPVTSTSLLVTWDPGASLTATPGTLRYSVYVATQKGGEDFHAPVSTVSGATSYTIANLTSGTDTYVVVRASDADGHQESNTVELRATAQADTTPPDFAGVASAVPAPAGKVKLSWSPATDDLSGSSAITYLVYAGEKSPVYDSPAVAKVTGATSIEVVVAKPQTPYRFVVRAEDAAGNLEKNLRELVSSAGADTEPPMFGGCAMATGTASNQVQVDWNPGHDDITPDADLWYDVYAFTMPGPHADVAAAVAERSVQGQTSATIGSLAADTKYYFLCRARDLSGNVGGNAEDATATTLKDVTPPDFTGVTSATPVSPDSYQVTVTWAAAADLQTAKEKIVYQIFTSSTAGGEDYTMPPAQTTTGQTQATLLVRPGETTYLVVRARDEAGNLSTSIKEVGVSPHISYDWQIQPIFTKSCVNGCHNLNQKIYNPILAAPVSYVFILSDGVVVPGDPSASWLYQDVSCPTVTCTAPPGPPHVVNHMPPSSTTNPLPTPADVALIHDWIAEGAPGSLPPGLAAPPGYP